MGRAIHLLATCEHGGHRLPAEFRALFAGHEALLASHAGYDPGALTVARDLAAAFAGWCPTRLLYSTTSRLLVDLNRSVGHPRLHGAPVRALEPAQRAAIVARFHRPYRERAEAFIAQASAAGARVVHVSCHSFTPVLDGRVREVDIGLLFDPRRPREVALARAWRRALARGEPRLRLRFNHPYRGTADGLTTALRRRFSDAVYSGLELEVNQTFPGGSASAWRALRRRIVASLQQALREETGAAWGEVRRTADSREPAG